MDAHVVTTPSTSGNAHDGHDDKNACSIAIAAGVYVGEEEKKKEEEEDRLALVGLAARSEELGPELEGGSAEEAAAPPGHHISLLE